MLSKSCQLELHGVPNVASEGRLWTVVAAHSFTVQQLAGFWLLYASDFKKAAV